MKGGFILNQDYTETQRGPEILAKERTILKNVYIWMAGGLALTAIIAWGLPQTALYKTLLSIPYFMIGAIIVELILVFTMSAKINSMSIPVAAGCFIAYAAINGVTLSVIFLIYRLGAIYSAFFSAAALFAVMSFWGIVTKRDLTGVGHFAGMAVIGLIIASLINIFLKSGPFDFIISFVGIIIFTLLTAYDTQKIKNMSRQIGSNIDETNFVRISIMGALRLYLDFINMFLFILRIVGRRR